VSEDNLKRLAPYVTSLPTQAGPNLNTISPELLAAFLPGTSAGTLAAPLTAARPFDDYDAAMDWIESRFGEDGRTRIEALEPDVSSDWFELRIEARLDRLRLTRDVVLLRDQSNACCKIVLALPEPD
jgi:type II secretory pathway component PulK